MNFKYDEFYKLILCTLTCCDLLIFSYDGDLMDDERILEWLTSQDVIEVRSGIFKQSMGARNRGGIGVNVPGYIGWRNSFL
jgi:hypothetical protein